MNAEQEVIAAQPQAQPTAGPQPIPFATKRTLGWLMCISGALIGIAAIVGFLEQEPQFRPWWNAAGIVLTGVIMALAIFGRIAPAGLLRLLWPAAAIAGPVLMLFSFAATTSSPAEVHGAPVPWLWEIEPVLVTFPLLFVRPVVAIVWALVSALTPAVSALLFLGAVPESVLAATPLHLGNVAFVVIYLGIAKQLAEVRRSEQQSLRFEENRARVAATSAEQAATSRIVHDGVLSVLTVAMHSVGRLTDDVRQMALRALSIAQPSTLSAPAESRTPSAVITGREAIALVRRSVQPIDAAFTIIDDTDDSMVPLGVAETMALAAAEAARNSVRHAGRGARRTLNVDVTSDGMFVTIDDDGRGFDPGRIAHDRAGVRGSIVQRMESLDGGHARVRSVTGAGTRVDLRWLA